ncbi:MAG TPA: hypothetical protein DCZ01_12955 [Elusimicrobia bacterium]|nr:MAG: hypothetical protein A2X37_04370 [Elusimicrobia bacterium GWA2_66_18]OGR73307.1 MAG: hypothetical protein A2X40_03720 [Elusimicrobia bacterium GWC2_65_9]HAZ09394.1 hypothetical protein [Elusimicrobiota bacterium]
MRAPWPENDFKDLRDSMSDHGSMLSAGHASLGKGASSCVFCHFSHQTKIQRPLWMKEGRLDSSAFGRESLRVGGAKTGLCLSCHDGSIAPALKSHSSLAAGSRRQFQAIDFGAGHPVGVDYLAAFHRSPDDYNDPALNPKIILEEGKVGCPSCHVTHDLNAVSASNVRDEACMDCHRR